MQFSDGAGHASVPVFQGLQKPLRGMKKMAGQAAYYTKGEEIANSLTHGVAALLSVAGLVVMVTFAALWSRSAVDVTAVAVFGASMIVLYTASTLYHAVPRRKKRAKAILQVFDHSSIYLLIAGSYTPFCLITLGSTTMGWALCIAEWVLAVVGISLQPILMKRGDFLNCLIYLLMGWLVMLVIKPLVAALPAGGIALLVAGGIAYSAGVFFYVKERIPFNHAIWHVFVFAGTLLQFLSVLLYVLPSSYVAAGTA